VGAEFLPQTQVLPLVDLVITHGGNNTITESFHFGKPTVVLPIFWDQHDNGQRVGETGYGVRLDTYSFTDDELRHAIDGVVENRELRSRLADVGEHVRNRNGLAVAADLIESVAVRSE
jgi:UDP:flavonoid glycosyltransferase YjiC (YdhE family)